MRPTDSCAQLESMIQSVLRADTPSVPLRRSKIVIVGRGRAGKTSLAKALVGTVRVEDELSTQGALIQSIVCHVGPDAQWATAVGPQSDLARAAQWHREHRRPDQPLQAPELQTQKLQSAQTPAAPARDIVGSYESDRPGPSENDSASRHPDRMPAALQQPAAGPETSFRQLAIDAALGGAAVDKDAVLFSIYDMAGPPVYYDLLQLLLSRESVYLVVFNMTEMRGDGDARACLAYIRTWLASLSAYAPGAPVFLVGTHLDEAPDLDLKSLSADIDKACEDIPAFKHVREYGRYQCFAAMDTGPLDPAVAWLRREIQLAINAHPSETDAYVHTRVPVAWLALSDVLRARDGSGESLVSRAIGAPAAASDKGAHRLAVETVFEVGQGSDFRMGKEDIDKFLVVMHGLGLLLHFPASPIVITNPQWLVSSVAAIAALAKKTAADFPRNQGLKTRVVEKYLSRLREQSLLHIDLLPYLWPDYSDTERSTVIDILHHHNLLVTVQHDEEQMYLVPSLLRATLSSEPQERQPTPLASELDVSDFHYAAPSAGEGNISENTEHAVYIFLSLEKLRVSRDLGIAVSSLQSVRFMPPCFSRHLLCALHTSEKCVDFKSSRTEAQFCVEIADDFVDVRLQVCTSLSAIKVVAPLRAMRAARDIVLDAIGAILGRSRQQFPTLRLEPYTLLPFSDEALVQWDVVESKVGRPIVVNGKKVDVVQEPQCSWPAPPRAATRLQRPARLTWLHRGRKTTTRSVNAWIP
eukprot:m.207941 g.207941  ORF g.207941 m.207941 type:complete len:754 (-) comp10128_c0_seq36:414-2675(-)